MMKSRITLLLVVLHIVIFIVAMFINDCPKDSGDNCTLKFLGRFSFQPFKENFFIGPSFATLQKMGALEWSKVVKEHQGWRLITCIGFHYGIMDLTSTITSLILIDILLLEFGSVRIGIAYLVSGFGGSVLSALLNQNGVAAGASGGIFGLMGLMLPAIFTNWTDDKYTFLGIAFGILLLPIFFNIGSRFQFIGSPCLQPYGNNVAHIVGGWISGFLLGFVFRMQPQFGWLNYQHNVYQYVVWLSSLILLIVGFTAGLVLLFQGVNANWLCSWYPELDSVRTSGRSFNDGVPTCQETGSDTDFTLTCQNGGKTKVYPSLPFITNDMKWQLCILQCS